MDSRRTLEELRIEIEPRIGLQFGSERFESFDLDYYRLIPIRYVPYCICLSPEKEIVSLIYRAYKIQI